MLSISSASISAHVNPARRSPLARKMYVPMVSNIWGMIVESPISPSSNNVDCFFNNTSACIRF